MLITSANPPSPSTRGGEGRIEDWCVTRTIRSVSTNGQSSLNATPAYQEGGVGKAYSDNNVISSDNLVTYLTILSLKTWHSPCHANEINRLRSMETGTIHACIVVPTGKSTNQRKSYHESIKNLAVLQPSRRCIRSGICPVCRNGRNGWQHQSPSCRREDGASQQARHAALRKNELRPRLLLVHNPSPRRHVRYGPRLGIRSR